MTTSALEKVSRNFGYGSPNASMYDLFYGFNRNGSVDVAPPNLDHQGYVFFTKPRFNLLDENIEPIDRLHYLSHDSSKSLGAAIRSYLMPLKDQTLYGGSNVRSDAVNDSAAFIPFLTNSLVSLSGFPDETTESSISKEGRAKQVRSYPDSRPELYQAYDLTATFETKYGDPHAAFFQTYRDYMLYKRTGQLTTFPDNIAYGETDHDMAMYIFLLGPDKRSIQKVARTGGGCYPTVGLSGGYFDWDRTRQYNTNTETISVPFHTDGILYNQVQILRDFNTVSRIFNSSLKDSTREDKFHKIAPSESNILNGQGYPYVDIDNNQLNWWLENDIYNDIMSEFTDDE